MSLALPAGRKSAATWVTYASLASIAAVLAMQPVQADDWPQHLGPHRSGISAETGLLEEWPAAGPHEVWRVPGGVGMSGMAVAGGKAFTMLHRGGQQLVTALDAMSGQEIWGTAIGPSYRNPMGDGPRATPTIVDDHVYAFSGEGILVALESTDGQIVWSQDTLRQNGAEPAEYGMACSPLVVEQLVLVTLGAPTATVVAYDRHTGQPKWKAGQDHPAGYSSPALRNVGGRRQVVVFTGDAALGLAPDSGDILWEHAYITDYGCNIATPLAYRGNVFLSSGENHGSVLLSLAVKGDAFDVQTVWDSYGRNSVLRNEWQTSVLQDGYLYGMDNVGGAGPITHLTCIDAATGKRRWQQPRFGKGNLIAADGKLFISTMGGELVVVRATPERFDELGRGIVLGPTRQAPALTDGLLYLRDDQEIVCLDVRDSAGATE